MKLHRPSAMPRAGMTLLEILVSAALTLIVCVLVAELSMGMLRGVKTAGTRMVFTQKQERLRHIIEDDLSKLAKTDSSMRVLSSELGVHSWSMELLLPVTDAATPWQTVRYRWERSSGCLWREVEGVTTQNPIPVMTGIFNWQAEWLRDLATDANGSPKWQDNSTLPAALRIKARLTGVWEEGAAIDAGAQQGTRECVMLLAIGGGAGGQ